MELNGMEKFMILMEKIYDFNGKFDFIKDGNGIIKEFYNNGNIKKEIEYINGNSNKAKEFYSNGKLLYEGGYKDNLREGNGTEYYPNGNIKFKGDYIKGERDGNGKEYYFRK